MVKIQIYMTFTLHRGENSDLHHIYTTCWENSDLHHGVVKIQIYKHNIYTMQWWKFRFTPWHGENSDLHYAMVKIQIYTTPWWKFRFTWHFHWAMVKSQIYTTFSPGRGENSDLHDIFTMPWY